MKYIFTKSSTLCILFSFSFMISCHDKDEKVTPDVDETSYFTDKKWITVNIESSPEFDFDDDGKLDKDVTKFIFEPCSLDDIMIFKSDKKLAFDEGATKCDPTDPQQVTDGTWSYDKTTKVLTHAYDSGEKISFKVEQNDGENLKLVYAETRNKIELKMIWKLKRTP